MSQDAPRRRERSLARVGTCRLTLAPYRWAFAEDNAEAIAAHWEKRRSDNPAFFDGIILLTSACRIDGDTLHVALFETRFRNYLYWRHLGFADTGAIDGFGSGIVRSSDGALLLVTQRPGNVNEGLHYLPGGFIDSRDIGDDGAVDIAASIVREVEEETGIAAHELTRAPGFIVVRDGPHLSVAVSCRVGLDAATLGQRVRRFLAADPASEVADVTLVRDEDDLAGLPLASYCEVLLPPLLRAAGKSAAT